MSVENERQLILDALQAAYWLGVDAARAVDFGREGLTKSMVKRERDRLNSHLQKLGQPLLSDEEYKSYEG